MNDRLRRLGLRVDPDAPPAPRAGWEKHLVACRRSMGDWPPRLERAIQQARQAYEQGTHEMVSETRDGWVFLYSVPRRVPTAPRVYFSKKEVA